MAGMVTFGFERVADIEAGIVAETEGRVIAMEAAANAVTQGGGKCDNLTFMTAFFGGFVDEDVNWDSAHINRRLLARNVDERVKHAFEVSKTVQASVGEPYVRRKAETDFADQIGLVLPGDPEYAYDGISYKIERQGVKHHPSFVGRMAFNGYQAGGRRGFEPTPRVETVSLLELERTGSHLKITHDASQLVLGTAAVRTSFDLRYGFYEYSKSVEKHIAHLRATVQPFIEGITNPQ